MSSQDSLESRVADLRRAFDREFAQPPAAERQATEDLISISIATDLYALKLCQLAALVNDRRVTPIPSRRPEILGVSGIRGDLVVVVSLALVLGYPPSQDASPWLALSSGQGGIALAFPAPFTFLRAAMAEIVAAPPETASRHVSQIVTGRGGVRRIVDVPSITRFIQSGAAGPAKER